MNTTALDRILEEAVASGVPGVAGGVTDANGTLFEGVAGRTVLGGGAAVGPETLFWIASMTKPITSVAAMQLVERGKLSLDAPIGEVLPQLAHPRVLENGALRPAKTALTLRHLLTHTSGFAYGFTNAELTAWMTATGNTAKPGELVSLDLPLLFEPGTGWAYGISTDWVGLAVEAASGQRLDKYFAEHITGPLGMKNTVFLPDAAQRERRAGLHRREADGMLAALPPAPAVMPEFLSGGGGLYSTVSDYLKFCRVFLNDGAGLVKPETVTAMSVNQVGQLRAGVITFADPAVPPADLFPGMDTKWSLAFMINPEPGVFGRSAGSLAWGGAANTYFWIDRARGIAAVMMMQILPSGDLAAMQSYFGFERAVYAAL